MLTIDNFSQTFILLIGMSTRSILVDDYGYIYSYNCDKTIDSHFAAFFIKEF